MQKLAIKLENGVPVNHPVQIDNLMQVFPGTTEDNLPEGYVPFVRIQAPELGPYDKELVCTYAPVNGVYSDVWQAVTMNSEEMAEKQQAVKDAWAVNGYASWTFNETLCNFEPPTPYPNDGNVYVWNEDTVIWELVQPE